MTQIPVELLTMPLAELRERVEYAERLALASRYVTPGTQYAGNSAAVQPQITESLQTGAQAASNADTPKASTPRKKATTKTEPATAPASASTPSPSTGPSAEELFDAAQAGDAATSGATEFSLDDIDGSAADAGDMLADFNLDGPAEIDYREVLTQMGGEKAAKWKADKDTASLAKARALMAEYGVERIGDLPDDKLKSFHEKFKDL